MAGKERRNVVEGLGVRKVGVDVVFVGAVAVGVLISLSAGVVLKVSERQSGHLVRYPLFCFLSFFTHPALNHKLCHGP